MKTLTNFFSWLFADFFFSLYEMAGNKFTSQVTIIGVSPRRKSPPLAVKAWILVPNTGDDIPTQAKSDGILYHFDGTLEGYNLYVLPGLQITDSQREGIKTYIHNKK